jgi:LPXTG-motif cell wall-anchored protein
MKQLLRVLLVLTLVLAMAAPAFAEPEVTAGADGAAGAVVEEGEFVESIPEKPAVDPEEIEPEEPKPEKPGKPGKGDDLYCVDGDGIPGGDMGLEEGENPNAPKTGDEANPVLWGALCLAALAGLVGMFKTRKKA